MYEIQLLTKEEVVMARGDIQKLYSYLSSSGRVVCPEFLVKENVRVFFARETEEIVAMCLLSLGYTSTLAYGQLHDVVVHPDHRGKGLAKKLFGEMELFAREETLDYLELTCNPAREAANALYVAMGFRLLASEKASPDGQSGTNFYRKYFEK